MIVVTGATGHIGNVLVRELVARGEQVRVLLLPVEDTTPLDGLPVNKVRGDVRDLKSLITAFKDADMVYHLAGVISILAGKNELLNQVNVIGTRNVVAACRQTGVRRLVYTSSIHAVREPPHGTVIDESSPYDPASVLGDYAKSKARATLEVLKGVGQGLDAVVVCPTGVIGPYDYRVSEMGQLILDFTNRKLKAYLDGAYDFVDVRDVARGLILAAEKGRAGESYLLSGKQITVRDLLSMLEEITGIKAPAFKVPAWLARTAGKIAPLYYRMARARPLFTTYSVDVLASNSLVSSARARRELDFSTRPIKESVVDAVAWFREHGYAPALNENRNKPGRHKRRRLALIRHRSAYPSHNH